MFADTMIRSIRIRILALIGTFALAACAGSEQVELDEMAWLEGTWSQQEGSESFIERWSKPRRPGSLLTGQGMFVREGDTNRMERLDLKRRGDSLIYVVTFPDRTVEFARTGTTETHTLENMRYGSSEFVTFVNSSNDFPNEITYRRQNDDSLYITLRGKENGRETEFVFRMRKER